jgi:hypothetical protein
LTLERGDIEEGSYGASDGPVGTEQGRRIAEQVSMISIIERKVHFEIRYRNPGSTYPLDRQFLRSKFSTVLKRPDMTHASVVRILR